MMQIVIDIPEDIKYHVDFGGDMERVTDALWEAVRNGTPLKILDDGTLAVMVDDYTKVKRVLVQDKDNNGGLFYADSD